jgi:hypothetical protein
MRRFGVGMMVIVALTGSAAAQSINDSAKGMLGSWEFSNSERDRVCTVTFKSERAGPGYRIEFEPKCLDQFPLAKDVTAWTYPDNDLLRFLDARGHPLVEFSEVESGMFEAPTPGFGVLFLQNAAEAAPAVIPFDQVTGDWALIRGTGKPLCVFTLAATPAEQGFAVAVRPGCDPAIARLNFRHWALDGDELTIVPERGNAWRFEQNDTNSWLRVPTGSNPYTLVRQ